MPTKYMIIAKRERYIEVKYVMHIAYFSSVFGTLVLEVTSHNFTVQSAEPDARSEPSQLKQIKEGTQNKRNDYQVIQQLNDFIT